MDTNRAICQVLRDGSHDVPLEKKKKKKKISHVDEVLVYNLHILHQVSLSPAADISRSFVKCRKKNYRWKGHFRSDAAGDAHVELIFQPLRVAHQTKFRHVRGASYTMSVPFTRPGKLTHPGNLTPPGNFTRPGNHFGAANVTLFALHGSRLASLCFR